METQPGPATGDLRDPLVYPGAIWMGPNERLCSLDCLSSSLSWLIPRSAWSLPVVALSKVPKTTLFCSRRHPWRRRSPRLQTRISYVSLSLLISSSGRRLSPELPVAGSRTSRRFPTRCSDLASNMDQRTDRRARQLVPATHWCCCKCRDSSKDKSKLNTPYLYALYPICLECEHHRCDDCKKLVLKTGPRHGQRAHE